MLKKWQKKILHKSDAGFASHGASWSGYGAFSEYGERHPLAGYWEQRIPKWQERRTTPMKGFSCIDEQSYEGAT